MSDRAVPPPDLTPTRTVQVTRVAIGEVTRTTDVAAAEEPLDVRLHGRSFAVIMRTPGEDRELAAGFLLSERIRTIALVSTTIYSKNARVKKNATTNGPTTASGFIWCCPADILLHPQDVPDACTQTGVSGRR